MTYLRDALNRLLARAGERRPGGTAAAPVSTDEEHWLSDEGYDEAYRRRDPATLTRAFTALQERRQQPARRHAPSPGPDQWQRSLRGHHARALAALLQQAMEGHPKDAFGIRRIRAALLQDQLLASRDVARWIRAHRRRPTPSSAARRPPRAHATLLAYLDETDAVGRVATRRGEPLDRLRRVSARIAAFAGWHPARATMYVLTGDVPVLSAVQAEVMWRTPFAARTRIVLTIDPTCTPHEVEAAYRAYRRAHFGRLKRLSAQHARLAVFAATHGSQPPAERMAEWNRTMSGARYRRLATFNRDCREAQERLTDFGPGVRKGWGRLP